MVHCSQGGSKHGESFWQENSGSFGLKAMQRMGWQKGKGLGMKHQGIAKSMSLLQKRDQSGLGSKRSRKIADEHQVAATHVFGSILAKLNAASQGKQVKDEYSGLNAAESVAKFKTKRQLYSRFKKRSTLQYSHEEMGAIFGRKEKAVEAAQRRREKSDADSGDGDPTRMQRKSGKSVADYFAEKLGNRAIFFDAEAERARQERKEKEQEENQSTEHDDEVLASWPGHGEPPRKKRRTKEEKKVRRQEKEKRKKERRKRKEEKQRKKEEKLKRKEEKRKKKEEKKLKKQQKKKSKKSKLSESHSDSDSNSESEP
ncbi:MAG: hypothetical protein MHM6MM_004204 [Cercozoa sp. M6MM]